MSISRAADFFHSGTLSRSNLTNDLKIGIPVATLPGCGIIGSVLGLVGPVSVICDWMKQQV